MDSSSKHIQLSVARSEEISLNDYDASYGEYYVNWKNIIFLPFNSLWQLLIASTVLLNAGLVVYDLAYNVEPSGQEFVDIQYYLCGLLYTIDTSLSIVHKAMPVYRSVREHEPKGAAFLVVDLITLIPFYEGYMLIKAATRSLVPNSRVKKNTRTLTLLRLYVVYQYYSKMMYSPDINQTVVVMVHHYLKLITFTHMLGAVWYYLSCWKCGVHNWTDNLRRFQFDSQNSLHWLFMCLCIIGNTFANNWRGHIRGEVTSERFVLIVAMLVGFVMRFMIFFGHLTRACLKNFRRRFTFVDKLMRIRKYLKDLNVDEEWQKKTMEYYNVYWNERLGIKEMPEIFKLLPAPLQKHVTLDIFWEALRHTHFYGTEDISFKRALSMEMKNEFFLPGDFVYRLNETKSKMVFIVSGILQVSTKEDVDSPLISFSNGTVLGETACLMPSKSVADVRCVTYCELQTLDIKALYRVLKNYHIKTKTLQERLQRRIHVAQFTRKHASMNRDWNSRAAAEDISIKWLKLQWRQLMKLQYHPKNKQLAVPVNSVHTSEYLDLLVLSEEVELKTEVICLRGSCPFILEPNSSFRRFTNQLVLFAAMVQSTLLPYNVAFNRRISSSLFAVCFVMDVIYFMDIYLKLSTAIKSRNAFITQFSKILKYRLKSLSFLIDITATVPLDYIVFAFGMSNNLANVLKLNRLLKMYAVRSYINMLENSVWADSLTVRLVKYLLVFVYTSYWFICFMYMLSCFTEPCSYYGWYHYNLIRRHRNDGYNTTGHAFYLTTFYVTSSYLGTKVSRQYEYIITDLMANYFVVMTGYYIFSFCYAELCATFILKLEKLHKYSNYMLGMMKFAKLNKMNGELRYRILKTLNFWWYHNQDTEIVGQEGILEDATADLKDKIVKQRVRQCLESVPLFSLFDKEILDVIAGVCSIKTLPSDAPIVTADRRPNWIHIILRGYCKMKSTMAGDRERDTVTILKSTDAFPVIEVFHQVKAFVNVTSITALELISIKYADLRDILMANPEIKKVVTQALSDHFAVYEGILLRKAHRLPEMIPAEHSLGPGKIFTYKIYDDGDISPEQREYLEPFLALGHWAFIRYFLLRKTIDPHGRFFFCWEMGRCFFSLVRTFISLTYTNLIVYRFASLSYIVQFLDATCLMDSYIRLHCQYYNELGIVVTHPWFTAKHYVKTAFAVDLIAIFPFDISKINQILGRRHRNMVHKILVALTRPWQLYRLIGFLNYFYHDIQRKSTFLLVLIFTVLVATILALLIVFLQMLACEIRRPDTYGYSKIICRNDSWITTFSVQYELTSYVVYVDCLYVTIAFFATALCGTFQLSTVREGLFFLVTTPWLFILRWLVLAKITSDRVGGNANLIVYQEQVKSFLNFIKKEYVDENLVKDTIRHYQYIWEATLGNDTAQTLSKFHVTLREDIVYSLFGPTLEAVEIFQGTDISVYRQMGIHMQVWHYQKDSEILRCNDVQGMLFIVHKGRVDIVIAGTRLCTLSQGGIFGCLEKQGSTRQTITATAKVHVELLAINSNEFYRIARRYDDIFPRLQQANFLHNEYMESKRKVYFDSESTSRVKLASTTSAVQGILDRILEKTKFLIKHDNVWYSWWKYLLCVHLATTSSIVFMFYVIMTNHDMPISQSAKAVIYILDIVFITKIYLEFHVTIVDQESGIMIVDHKIIMKTYVKSVRFWLGVFTSFPFEIIMGFITTHSLLIKYSLGNRCFRFIYLVLYYNYSRYQLHVKTHLRWTYLIYWICIAVQLMTCMWWLAACFDDHCYYIRTHRQRDKNLHVKAEAGIDSIVLAYGHVVNTLTATGLQEVKPRTLTQLWVSILMICIGQFTIVALTSEFATLLEIEHYTRNIYEYSIYQLRTYLQGRQLSPPILDKVWTYCLQLWQRQRGEWMPVILKEAPGYLKQDLMIALYGHHLNQHLLFMNTHADFLRQIVVHLQRCVFFPGNYLVQKGDMDASMYFIHDGEVEVYEEAGKNSILRLLLKKGESFGEAQGLYNLPHDVSYKAKTVVDALILKRSDWEYLLDWFPATRHTILQRAAEEGLRKTKTTF